MAVLVTEAGFVPDDWTAEVLPFDVFWSGQDLPEDGLAVEFPNDRDAADLAPWLDRLAMIRVAFPSMGDGRGFSIASRLRAMGYAGRLRAAGAAGRRPVPRGAAGRVRRDRAARRRGGAAAGDAVAGAAAGVVSGAADRLIVQSEI